jgi:hypothetical protein
MKLVICVKSCQNDMERGDHDIIRQTWGADAKNMGVVVKFFVGQRHSDDRTALKYEADEALLSVKDDYASLPFKTREICARMVGKVLDGLFICDTDTFIDVLRLMATGMENYDYAGFFHDQTKGTLSYDAIDRDGNHEPHTNIYNWASGGYGYFLSMRAAEMVADSYPSSWAEDLWVGQVIGAEVADGTMTVLNLRDQKVSEHFPSTRFHRGYDIEQGHPWMQRMYHAHQ